MNAFSRMLITFCALAFFSFSAQEQQDTIIVRRIPKDSTVRRNLDSLLRKFPATIDQHKLATGWSKLKKGMTQKEVVTLLGRPTGIEDQIQAGEFSMTWHYGKRFVIFDGIEPRVRTWSD